MSKSCWRLEIELAFIYDRNAADLVTCLQSMLSYWHLHQDGLDTSGTGYRFQVVHLPGRRGRPAFGIASSQLEYLHSLGFTWTEMAALFGVSSMTLYRRRHQFGMLNNPSRTVSDQELTQHVQRLRASSPYTGESMILGQLRALNVNVSRERVRHTIRQIDPLNTAQMGRQSYFSASIFCTRPKLTVAYWYVIYGVYTYHSTY